MKLLDILLFTISVAFFIIGIYETMALGIAGAYSSFMLSLGLLFVFGYRKSQRKKTDTD